MTTKPGKGHISKSLQPPQIQFHSGSHGSWSYTAANMQLLDVTLAVCNDTFSKLKIVSFLAQIS
jgi:hypothetical protein